MALSKEQENFCKIAFLNVDVVTEALRTLLDYHLTDFGCTLEMLLNAHKHKLFHLYINKQCQNNSCKHPIPNKRVLSKHQLSKLFNTLATTSPFRNFGNFTHCLAIKGLCSADLDVSMLRVVLSMCCIELFWKSCLAQEEKSFEDFLNEHKHDLYHLWQSKTCCKCNQYYKPLSDFCVLKRTQFQRLFSEQVVPSCIPGTSCMLCSCSVYPALAEKDVEDEVAIVVQDYFCPLKKIVNKLVDCRNNCYSHVNEAKFSDTYYKEMWNNATTAIEQLSIHVNKKDELQLRITEVESLNLNMNVYGKYMQFIKDQIEENKEIRETVETESLKITQRIDQMEDNIISVIKTCGLSNIIEEAIKKNGEELPDNMDKSAKRPRLAENGIIKILGNEDPKSKRIPPMTLVSARSKEVLSSEVETGKRLMVPGGEHDDPSLDLTDGPVMVRVEPSTRQFYIEHYKKSYRMTRIPRGNALIVNVNEVEGKPPRRGTNIDRDNLYHLFSQLHFDVSIYNDIDGLTAKEIAIKLQKFSELPDHQNADACVVCLLSHGEEGYIFGTDGRKIFLDNIMSLFENGHCKDLRGKPKIVIIQACRGEALDSGVVFVDRHDESQRTTFQLRTKSDILISVPAHTGVQHSGKMYGEEHDGSPCKPYQLPTMSDMLICFPTQTGHYAWRNKDRGSWYIEALVQVFMKFARTEDVCTMLNRVNSVISRKLSNCQQIEMNQMSQMSEYKSTLRMPHFFFFPGIGNE